MRALPLLVLLLAASQPAWAQKPGTDPLPPPPPMPEHVAPTPPAAESGRDQKPGDEPIEPEITITTRGGDRYEEHRYNGQLYMIKVTPARGKPYYLVDEEGRGQFRRSDLEPQVSIPMWVIKRF